MTTFQILLAVPHPYRQNAKEHLFFLRNGRYHDLFMNFHGHAVFQTAAAAAAAILDLVIS